MLSYAEAPAQADTDTQPETTYKIVRFCFDENHEDHLRIIYTGLTREEAQELCHKHYSQGEGWFDGWEQE